MAQSGSFGVNPDKDYGTDPVIMPAKLLDRGSNVDGEWIFAQANGAIDQYAFCVIDEAGQAAMLTTSNAEVVVGIPQVALADNEYAWFWVGGAGGGATGTVRGLLLANYVANNALYTTATAGRADDTATTLIANVVGSAATGGSAASVPLFSSGYLSTRG